MSTRQLILHKVAGWIDLGAGQEGVYPELLLLARNAESDFLRMTPIAEKYFFVLCRMIC